MTLCVSCPDGHRVPVAADKLGRAVACPCCFAVFDAGLDLSAARQARKEEKKARRSRDDDDDDDEDEKPQKKKPKAKAEEPKKKEAKPAPKKTARKKDDDDDEEDEEDEEEDGEPEEEEEFEIDWTPRKRQLHLCTIGVNITMGAFGTLLAFTVVVCLWLDWCENGVVNDFRLTTPVEKIFPAVNLAYGETATYVVAPFFTLAQVVLMVALFFSLSVPAKAEARSLAISGLVFGFLFFVFGTLVLLAAFQVVVDDAIRAENMMRLMGGAAGLCFVISLMSMMAFQAKLMMFMNMKLEASQAVTNVGFYFLYLAAPFACLYASVYVCNYLHYWLGYAVILAMCAASAMAGRMLYAHIVLMLKMNRTINTYIREAV